MDDATRLSTSGIAKRPALVGTGLDPWLMAAVLVGTVDVAAWWTALRSGVYWPGPGMDLATYTDAARSFLGGTGFYHAYQLAGPYAMDGQPILYPPSAIPLFAAFTVLPGFLWWAIPLGVLAWRLPRDRRLWAVLALLAWPQTAALVWAGNPVMWMAAALSLGFAPLVLLKPTLAPFALIGFGSRRWWTGLAVLAVLSLAFVPLWADYVTVLPNARDEQGWLYVAGNVPLMVVGWLASQDRPQYSTLRLHGRGRLRERGRGDPLIGDEPVDIGLDRVSLDGREQA